MRILLVEDDPGDVALFRKTLGKTGENSFAIEVATSLSNALEMLEKESFDVIVTELYLPDSPGIDTVLEFRGKAGKKPLLVLTNADEGDIDIDCLRAGVQEFLLKDSLEPMTLIRALRHSIVRKQMDWELREARKRMRILHNAASFLATCSRKKKAYEITVEYAEKLLPGSAIQLIVRNKGMVTIVAASPGLEDRIGRRSVLDRGLAGMTLVQKQTFQFTSGGDGRGKKTGKKDYVSGISAPVGSHAVLQVFSTSAHAFTGDDTGILEMLCGHLAETLDRITLDKKLKSLAIHDPLTGVFNRNFFQIALNREKRRAERYHSSIGFLMIDIDNFKEINDMFGHMSGDRVLREVASYLTSSVRSTDYVVRYGGDEFMIILIETDQTASLVKDRLLSGSTLAEKTIKLLGKPVTLSIGHSQWKPDTGISIREALTEADRRMYQHKKNK